MKVQHILLLSLLTFVLFSACKKDKRFDYSVRGQVLEYGTNIPVENAVVKIHKCRTDGSSVACHVATEKVTDATGSYDIPFLSEGGSFQRMTVTADNYFDSREMSLVEFEDNEFDVVLDPFAWLHLSVKNIAPAEEFDRIDLSSSVSSTPGSPESLTGVDINEEYVLLKRGNKPLGVYWWVYDSGIIQSENADTIHINAHDTLFYEISY